MEKGFDVTNIQTFIMDAKSGLDIDNNEDLMKAREYSGQL